MDDGKRLSAGLLILTASLATVSCGGGGGGDGGGSSPTSAKPMASVLLAVEPEARLNVDVNPVRIALDPTGEYGLLGWVEVDRTSGQPAVFVQSISRGTRSTSTRVGPATGLSLVQPSPILNPGETSKTTTTAIDSELALAADASGNLLVAWARTDTTVTTYSLGGQSTSVSASAWANAFDPVTQTWRGAVKLGDPGTSVSRPSAAIGGDGKAFVVWRQTSSGGTSTIRRVEKNGGSTAWSAPAIENQTGNLGAPSIALGGDGSGYIVWSDSSAGGGTVYLRPRQ